MQKQPPELLVLLESHSAGTLCYARVDHVENLQDSEDRQDFPAEQLQAAFLDRLASSLSPNTVVESLAFGIFAWVLDSERPSKKNCDVILEAFKSPFDYEMHTAFVTLSISIADISSSSDSSVTLSQLEHALRNAQAQGGDRCYLARADRDVLSQIPAAIEREEFSIYFQGVWSAEKKHLVGAEALLRWHGMDINNIDPGQLIRMAEEGGKMSSLGNWITHKACAHASSWLENWASPLTLGINISTQQFRSPNFVAQITQSLESTWLDPKLLELEIRYSDFQSLLDESAQSLLTLNRLGIRLALDNIDEAFFSEQYAPLREAVLGRKTFVAGSSASLAIGIRNLKFSPQLVVPLFSGANTPLYNQVKKFIQDCKQEAMTTTAVGVESEQILQGVCDSGFDFAQGYFLGKPMNSTDFNRFTRSERNH